MKENELMIDDWVLVSGNPMQIQAINDIDGEIMAGDELYCLIEDRVHSEDKIEPVPLTAEILEKNGFVGDKQVMQYYFTEDGQKYHFSLRQMYDKDDNPKGYSFFAFNVLTIIDYVHQLQHALRLCGIDKEIVL